MPIKNYTTKVPVAQTVGEIQTLLATHGARRIMMDYEEDGSVKAVTFGLEIRGVLQGFRLEAKANGVINCLKSSRCSCNQKQAERIAWRNIKDWIAAQVALYQRFSSGVLALTDGGDAR